MDFSNSSLPDFHSSFPVLRLTTWMAWNDAVLRDTVHSGLTEIMWWLQHRHTLKQVTRKDNGYKVLFHGPSGTGKTLTATLFGKQCSLDVYKFDVALLLTNSSADIERITREVFLKADQKSWILLVEHAEKIFTDHIGTAAAGNGLRSTLASLLFEIDNFPGVIIFETNAIEKLSKAFINQLNGTIQFSLPDAIERAQLWKSLLPNSFALNPDIDLDQIGETAILSASEISGLIEQVCIRVLARNDFRITNEDINAAILKLQLQPGRQTAMREGEVEKRSMRIFISYSSKDRKMKELLVGGLKAHLMHKENIKYFFWEDKAIEIGSNWQDAIVQALKNSGAAILLVSANFAASDYIKENELKVFLQKQQEEGCLLFPVLVRNFVFRDFKELSQLNFFKTYYDEYGFDDPQTRHELLPFDVLGDDEKTPEKKFHDYYRKLSDHIHSAVTNHFENKSGEAQ